jgi:hypothetical protein
MNGNTAGSNNVAVGYGSLYNVLDGSYNVAIGYNAGYNSSFTFNGYNCTYIGNGAEPSANNESNVIVLGNDAITALKCNVQTITGLSDARDKKDITSLDVTHGLSFVEQLNPVRFSWNMRSGAKVDVPDIGFIAQDLLKAQEDSNVTVPGLVDTSNPEKLQACYGKLLPIMVQSIKDLKKEIDDLRAKLQ